MNIDDVLNEAIQLNKAHRRFLRPSIADLLYHPTQRNYRFRLEELDNSTFEITLNDEREIDDFDSYVSDQLRYQTLQPDEFYRDDWDASVNNCVKCSRSILFGTYWCEDCNPLHSGTAVDDSDYTPLLSLDDLNFDDEGFPIPERNDNISYVSPYREPSESFYHGIGGFK